MKPIPVKVCGITGERPRQRFGSERDVSGASRARQIRIVRLSTLDPPRSTIPGFTLVELLVATAVSLLIILALAQGFATISETLRLSRASLEMAARLHGVSHRLQRDLDGATAGGRLWIPTSEAQGYLEIYDGPSCDMDVDSNGAFDKDQVGADHSFGDIDDVLMLTARSDEDDLFLGQITGTVQRSDVAEVVWWTRFNDYDGDGVQDPEERFNVYRRNLLVRPDLNVFPSALVRGGLYFQRFPQVGTYNVTNQAGLGQLSADVQDFLRRNDISVHFEADDVNSNQCVVFAVANSLSDLTLRHNRYCHDPIVYRTIVGGPLSYTNRHIPGNSRPDVTRLFPHRLNINVTNCPANVFSPFAFPSPQTYYSELSLYNLIRSGDRTGEDIVLSNTLAFDVRVFDPTALTAIHPGADLAYGVSGNLSEAGWPGTDDDFAGPGDYGYRATLFPVLPAGSPSPPHIRLGAYVDLAFIGKQNWGFPAIYPVPSFGGTATFRSQLVGTANPAKTGSPIDSGIYDTWTYDYESDGINQDSDRDASNTANVDEVGNGIDDEERLQNNTTNAANGPVDDAAEIETQPPYPVPLRSIQVRVRIIDPDTRQIRQTSVVTDYPQ